MNLFSNRSSVGVKSYNSLLRLLLVLLLVAALPVFIWAVMTQRIELRKRAATSEPPVICWNKVGGNDPYFWPNGCKGNPEPQFCSQATVQLIPSEVYGYQQWVNSGKPYIPGCGAPTPTPTVNPYSINWATPFASLTADELTIVANGKTYKGTPTVTINSDPSDSGDPNYTTLEMTWNENNTEMRLYIYFAALTAQSYPPERRWSVSSFRIYNGNTPGDWIYFTGPNPFTALIGSAYTTPSLTLTSSENGIGQITFKNLKLQAFTNERPQPTPTCVPRPTCNVAEVRGGDGQMYCPTADLQPGVSYCKPGCYYQQVQCVRAPCNPILVCPSPTPSSACSGPNGSQCEITKCVGYDCPAGQICPAMPRSCAVEIGTCQNNTCVHTTTPTPTCTPRPPCMDPAPGEPACMYKLAPGAWLCPKPTTTPVATCKDTDGGREYFTKGSLVYTNNPNGIIQENDSCDGNTLIEGVCNNQSNYTLNHERYTCPNGCFAGKCMPTPPAGCFYRQVQCAQAPCEPILICPTATPTPTVSPTTTPTPTPLPSQTMAFKVKLAGVAADQANGAKISVKLYKKDGPVQQFSSSLTLTHIGSGVYQASANVPNPYAAGTQLRIQIKAEKHAAVMFSHLTSQTNQCADEAYISMPAGGTITFDFTGVPLPAGDTAQQDNQVNQTDIDRVVALMSKSNASLTTQDKLAGDLNYDQYINTSDLLLIYKTLQTRCD